MKRRGEAEMAVKEERDGTGRLRLFVNEFNEFGIAFPAPTPLERSA
jgi:hypothetical protein